MGERREVFPFSLSCNEGGRYAIRLPFSNRAEYINLSNPNSLLSFFFNTSTASLRLLALPTHQSHVSLAIVVPVTGEVRGIASERASCLSHHLVILQSTPPTQRTSGKNAQHRWLPVQLFQNSDGEQFKIKLSSSCI
ncbi:hypothetical protein ACOSQ2_015637 [Xanthoceras sorbifolium]